MGVAEALQRPGIQLIAARPILRQLSWSPWACLPASSSLLLLVWLLLIDILPLPPSSYLLLHLLWDVGLRQQSKDLTVCFHIPVPAAVRTALLVTAHAVPM